MTSVSNWSPYENYIQDGHDDGRFMSAAFTLLAAGPPRLSGLGMASSTDLADALSGSGSASEIVHPIGVTQTMNLGHNRQFSRFWELGSERSYFVAGRTVGQMGLSRILYHGPSLLRTLYAYYEDNIPPTTVPAIFENPGIAGVANQHDVKIPAGYENLFLNLASDLFTQPVGLLIYLRDSNEDTVGAAYLESCYVPNHNLAMDAQGVVLQESAALQFERMVPVRVGAVSLVSGITGEEVETAA